MILDYLSNSILKWAAIFWLSKLIQTEDVGEFKIPNLPNRMKTSFYSFSYHILSSINENCLLLVRYDSGRTITKDRCSLPGINYWAPTLISILYDFWERLGQSEREIRLDIWFPRLWVRRIWSCRLLSLGQDSNDISMQLQFLFYGISKGGVRENQTKEMRWRAALSTWSFCNDGNVL